MGLLSRFGAGLVKAAPIFGGMAQTSLQEEQREADKTFITQSDLTKHNRLLGREKTARTEARDLLKIKGEQASAAAQSGALQKYFADSKAQLYTLWGVQEREMGDFNKQLENPLVTGERAKEINRLKDALAARMAATQESIKKYDRLQRQYVDPEGTILPGAPLVNDDYLSAIAVGSAREVIDAYGIDSTGRTSLVHSPLIRDQIDTLNSAIGSEFGLKPLTKKEEDLFTELVNDVIKDAEKSGERKGLPTRERPSETTAVEDPDEVVVEKPSTKIPRTTATGGGTSPWQGLKNIHAWFNKGRDDPYKAVGRSGQLQNSVKRYIARLSEEGKLFWSTFEDASEELGVEAAIASLAVQFEALSNADKEIMSKLNSELSTNEIISDDVTMQNTPGVEDAISMLFNPKSMS